MKKILKIFSIIFLVCFSFYYTERIAIIMKNKDSLMIEINEKKEGYYQEFVNATINGDYIVPGINGLEVNCDKSYTNMKSFNVFNEYYLVFDQVKPQISLDTNKDKIIIKGNKNKKAIAFIIKNNEDVKMYLQKLGYDCDSKNICLLDLNKKCVSTDYKIKATKNINHQNFLIQKNKVESGDIILLEENISIEEIKLLLEEIKYRDLKILSLNELISEENIIK